MKQLMRMKRARMSGADERGASRTDEGGSVRGRVRLRALARMLALVCALLAVCGMEARAQSALDGFDPGANGTVFALALQADGKILVGGDFTMLGGGTGTTTRNLIGRLNVDGSPDTTFDPGANSGSAVHALALQADGKILAGGAFTGLGGGTGTTARSKIGRLTNTDAALQSLTVSFRGTSVRWLRSGASPELERVTFELSTDGITYTPLGDGSRINNGWILTGLSLPAQQNIYVRARGFYHTGYFTGSYSVVESVRNAFITINPNARGTLFDFDGDRKSDVSIWNPSNHNWYILQSNTNTTRVQLDWGNGSLGDIAVPADYDGDGKTDIAVPRKATGTSFRASPTLSL